MTPFGLAGPTLFFTGAPNAPDRTHGAEGTVRCNDWGGAQVLIGGALEIIGGARAPPMRYKVPPLVEVLLLQHFLLLLP